MRTTRPRCSRRPRSSRRAGSARLPLSQLKIDRSFVADLTTVHAERVRPIIRGIVQLGHSLDLTVVTEGIETPDQLAIVTALGADLAQGHLFGDYAPGR